MSMPKLEESLQEAVNIVVDWVIDGLNILGMLSLNVPKGDLGLAASGSIGGQIGSVLCNNQAMDNPVPLSFFSHETCRKRELQEEVGEKS